MLVRPDGHEGRIGICHADYVTTHREPWPSAADPLEALGILYAIEAGQPAVSRTKLDGLVEHYGFEPESPATSYFTLHAERDHEHAAESRDLLERHARPEDADRIVGAAERALIGNWSLLDGVDAAR